MKNTKIISLFVCLLISFPVFSQIELDKELMEFYTAEWSGDRLPDGRPKVSDELLKRLKNISIEEVEKITDRNCQKLFHLVDIIEG